MTIDDIIDCMNVVAYFNISMGSLRDAFIAQAPTVARDTEAVNASFGQGTPVYDTLVRINVQLANAVHDYSYNVVYPHDSNITKNVMREQICREIFGLETHF